MHQLPLYMKKHTFCHIKADFLLHSLDFHSFFFRGNSDNDGQEVEFKNKKKCTKNPNLVKKKKKD